MQVGAIDQQALAMQMQMMSQMSSVTKDPQVSMDATISNIEENMLLNEQAMASSIAALASGTIDNEVVTEIYA